MIKVAAPLLLALLANASETTNPFGRVSSDSYLINPSVLSEFREKGYASLEAVLTEDEIAEMEVTYNKFMRREIHVPGKDFCDMSKPFETPFEEYSIINCMLPTKYHPPFQQNIYERLAEKMAAQLYPGAVMVKDYDQLLNKRPHKGDAVFGWHQDMAYWPPKTLTPDTRTVTFSLAIDATTETNGCIKFVPGSHKTQAVRAHNPVHGSREEGHAVQAEMFEDDVIVPVPTRRGSCTIHDEWVVHGSGGNDSDGDRRTYVIAFRTNQTVTIERSHGFTHSHNDEVNWDTFKDIPVPGATGNEL